MQVSITAVYKAMADKYQLRFRGQKNQLQGPLPAAQAPLQVVQIDTRGYLDRCLALPSAGMNSKKPSFKMFPYTARTIGSPDPTRIMNRVLWKV